MEEHVAAFADGEEVEMLDNAACKLPRRKLQDILSAASNVLCGWSVTALGNEGARRIAVPGRACCRDRPA
jgi:hypothetical protein